MLNAAIRPLARHCLRSIPRRTVSSLSPVVYTAVSTSTGSRAAGHAETANGNLKLKMAMPKEMGGTGKKDSCDPEMLFGLAYSTCYLSALSASHASLNPSAKPLGKDATVRALVSIGKQDKVNGFALAVTLEVLRGPLAAVGLDRPAQKKLVEAAHALCPYSRAIKGNIEVEIRLTEA